MKNGRQPGRFRPHRHRLPRWVIFSTWLCLSLFTSAAGQPAAPEDSETAVSAKDSLIEKPLRLGFSYSLFIGLNMTDARNSIKALTTSIAREINIPAESDPYIFLNVDEAENVLNSHALSAVSLTASEFWLLRHKVKLDRFLITTRKENPANNYLVLAREDGPIKTLADLRGKHLLIYDNPSMCLATVFIDVELAKQSLPPTKVTLGRISEITKPAKVVLPVFFGQADACLITRYTYEMMVELNPQVGRRLRVITTSPDYVTALFGFHAELPSVLREKYIHAFIGLSSSIFGKQTLAIFQGEEIKEIAPSVIEPSIKLLDEHARLCPEANAALIALLRGMQTAPKPQP